jgi:acyl carrier protein
MNSNTEYRKQIREFLSRDILFCGDVFPHDDDTSLIGEGIVDSMGVVEVVMFVQSTFGITVDPQEVTRENFDSVSKLARYVGGKLERQSEADYAGTSVSGR